MLFCCLLQVPPRCVGILFYFIADAQLILPYYRVHSQLFARQALCLLLCKAPSKKTFDKLYHKRTPVCSWSTDFNFVNYLATNN